MYSKTLLVSLASSWFEVWMADKVLSDKLPHFVSIKQLYFRYLKTIYLQLVCANISGKVTLWH